MVELALKALLLITLGQHIIMGLNDHRGDRSLESDEESLYRYRKIDKQTAKKIFVRVDKNRDRHLSFKEMRDEWSYMRRETFDKYDRDNDGFLRFSDFWQLVQDSTMYLRSLEMDTESLYQYPRIPIQTAKRIFIGVDKNGDNRLSFKEMRDKWSYMRRETFDYYDRDNDSFLRFSEYWQLVMDYTRKDGNRIPV